MPYEQELNAALQAAGLASEHILTAYATFEEIPDARASITTEVDHQSQEIILRSLSEAFPADAFCAEEATASMNALARTGSRMWIIDPIDGTRGFAKKNDEFSVMVALIDEEGIVVGVVQEPAKQRITFASRGGGCWKRDGDAQQPERCRVSPQTELLQSTLTTSHDRPGKTNPIIAKLSPAKVMPTYSAGIKLALVARGEADLYVNTYPAFHDWDICAGQILTEEAGGRVTGLRGSEVRYASEGFWQRGGLLATNTELHDLALEHLR